MADIVPLKLSLPGALKRIRELGEKSECIVLLPHATKRRRERQITRRQIEHCIRKGAIIDGPFQNIRGNWQVTIQRNVAGDEITCVVVIDWPNRLLVITTY